MLGNRLTKHQFSYNSAGKLSAVTDSNGNVTPIDWNDDSVTITPPLGGATQLTLDHGSQYATSISGPNNTIWQLKPNLNGLLETMVDPRGVGHDFTYDSTGRLLSDGIRSVGATTVSLYQALATSSQESTLQDITDDNGNTILDGSGNSVGQTRVRKRVSVHTSAENLSTTYVSQSDGLGRASRVVTLPTNDTATIAEQPGGVTTYIAPDKTKTLKVEIADSTEDMGATLYATTVTLPQSRRSVTTTKYTRV